MILQLSFYIFRWFCLQHGHGESCYRKLCVNPNLYKNRTVIVLHSMYGGLVCLKKYSPRLYTRVGSKYTFWDQVQIQLSQIKYIAFLDFNRNTLPFFVLNTVPFWRKKIQYMECVSIIVQVHHSAWNFDFGLIDCCCQIYYTVLTCTLLSPCTGGNLGSFVLVQDVYTAGDSRILWSTSLVNICLYGCR